MGALLQSCGYPAQDAVSSTTQRRNGRHTHSPPLGFIKFRFDGNMPGQPVAWGQSGETNARARLQTSSCSRFFSERPYMGTFGWSAMDGKCGQPSAGFTQGGQCNEYSMVWHALCWRVRWHRWHGLSCTSSALDCGHKSVRSEPASRRCGESRFPELRKIAPDFYSGLQTVMATR